MEIWMQWHGREGIRGHCKGVMRTKVPSAEHRELEHCRRFLLKNNFYFRPVSTAEFPSATIFAFFLLPKISSAVSMTRTS